MAGKRPIKIYETIEAYYEANPELKTGRKASKKAVCRGKAASKGVKASKLASKPRKGKK